MGCCCVAPKKMALDTSIFEDPGELVTMVYLSRMVPGYFDNQKDVNAMVRFARSNNIQLGLSGYLLVAPPFFLQRLEGPERPMNALVNGIRGDHRHDNFIVVERHAIERRSYGNWSMRSFDLVRSAGAKFEAVSFILQSLSRGLQIAHKTIHPKFFDTLLAGKELEFEDHVQDAIIVTVALGPSVVRTREDGKVVADVVLINTIVDHLQRRVCGLSPEGRGSIAVCGGTVLQVAVRIHPVCTLANKVVRACVELASGQGGKPQGQFAIHVGCGRLQVMHLISGADMRKGRYLYGDALSRGIDTAKSLLEGTHPLVVQEVIAKQLVDEFLLEAVGPGLYGTELKGRPTAVLRLLVGPGRWVRTCEGALAALTMLREDKELTEEVDFKEAVDEMRSPSMESVAFAAAEDETDLEWMYQLETLSKAYARTLRNRKRQGPRRFAPQTRTNNLMSPKAMSRRAMSIASFNNGTQLLNIMYLSVLTPEYPLCSAEIIEIGRRAAKSNASLGVTGFLLYTKPFFLQYLEGAPAQVKDLYTRIRRDPRHANVTILVSRVMKDGVRNFGDWAMRTTDLDSETAQETAPLREVLRLLTRQFNQLRGFLPRLQHDILLSTISVAPGSLCQSALVAFAVLPPPAAGSESLFSPMLQSLSEFLAHGGELLGFLGDHLVGYVFANHLEVLLDEVADLCADLHVFVGVAAGNMLLLNAGIQRDDCDIGFYGTVFERAQDLANRALRSNIPIVADRTCEANIGGVRWEGAGNLLYGYLDL